MYTFFKNLAKCKEKPDLADYFRQSLLAGEERTVEASAVSLRTVQRMLCNESKLTGNQEELLCVGSSNDLKFRSPRKNYNRDKSVAI